MEPSQLKFEKRDRIHRDISVILIIAMVGLLPRMKNEQSLYLFMTGLAVPALINFYFSYRNHQSVGKGNQLLKKRGLILGAGLLILALVELL